MKMSIQYCTSWGYLARAARVADVVANKFGNDVEIDLIPSSGGVFEIKLDGELFFSKKETGRFPDQDEIDGMLNTIAGKK